MRAAPLILVLLAACTDGWIDTGDTSTVDDSCPDGMQWTTNAEAQVTSLQIDGAAFFAGLDPTALYDGQSAACASDDLSTTRLILAVGTEPYVTVTQTLPALGDYDPNGTDATLTIEVAGDSPFTVAPGDWVSGTWSCTDLGLNQSTELLGEAFASGHSLGISLFARVGR